MHARTSGGLADYMAEDEQDAIRIGRRIMARLNWRKNGPPGPTTPPHPPVHDPPDQLLGIASVDPKVPFDPRDVIARVVDGSAFDEFKPLYGTSLVTGWAAIHGFPVASSPTHGGASCSVRRLRRVRSSSNWRIRSTPPSSSCRTPPVSWSVPSTSRAASSRTAPR